MINNQITFGFYLMTSKGYEIIKTFHRKFGLEHISFVIGDSDETLTNDYYNEIKSFCLEKGIPFNNRSATSNFVGNYNFAISWKYIIEECKNLIVLHDSILPKYRGFAPLINALINGEKEIGVTALFANKPGYDEGDIISQRRVNINYPIKIGDAIKLISPLYSDLVCEISQKVIENQPIESEVQIEDHASYSLWRNEDDFQIDWSLDSNDIARFIDTLGEPYKGASTILEEKIIRIYSVEILNDKTIENRDAGKILFIDNGFPVVVCGKGIIKLTDVRNDNGETMIPFKKMKLRFK